MDLNHLKRISQILNKHLRFQDYKCVIKLTTLTICLRQPVKQLVLLENSAEYYKSGCMVVGMLRHNQITYSKWNTPMFVI